jgi:aryl-alcohol dehydrogenase-like predicted oxidoreductase
MQHRNLGRSGLKVSTLCLGGMTFGEADEKSFMHKVGSDEETSYAVLDRAVAAGVSFVDVADVYGQDGLSERVLGRWFQRTKKRGDVVLATKFRFKMGDRPNDAGASRYRIVHAVEESLRRLQTDRIDLYQIHMQDPETPEDETLRALDDLVRAGKVLYIGASNYAAWRLVESVMTSVHQGLERFVSLQASYSLMVRDLERELVPACLRHGLGVLPYAPLAQGFLSGKHRRGERPTDGTRLAKFKDRFAQYDNDRGWNVVDAVRAVAAEHETTPTAVALAWLLQRPAVTSVIFGARSVAQLDENVRAAELALTPEQVKRLDDASAVPLGYPYEFIQRMQPRR